MNDSLPRLKEGDKIEGGQACIQPAHLSYCDGCECLRVGNNRWRVRRIDGYPYNFCERHATQEEK